MFSREGPEKKHVYNPENEGIHEEGGGNRKRAAQVDAKSGKLRGKAYNCLDDLTNCDPEAYNLLTQKVTKMRSIDYS